MSTALKREELHIAWEKIRSGRIAEDGDKVLSSEANINQKTAIACLGVIDKVAKKGSFEDFVTFIETKEIPTLKLSRAEMEALKGGSFPSPWSIVKLVLKGVTIFT
jgi:hypothetical protein